MLCYFFLLNSKGIMAIPMSAYSAGIEVEATLVMQHLCELTLRVSIGY